MLGLTASWIDRDFVLKKVLLHSTVPGPSHSSSNCVGGYDFKMENSHRESPRCAERQKATDEFGVPSLPCMAHPSACGVGRCPITTQHYGCSVVGKESRGVFQAFPTCLQSPIKDTEGARDANKTTSAGYSDKM